MYKSLKYYLFDAYYQYFTENNIKINIRVNTSVPSFKLHDHLQQYVNPQNKEIIFNISPTAVSDFSYDYTKVEFCATFGGIPIKIDIPFDAIIAVIAVQLKIMLPLFEDPLKQFKSEIEQNTQQENVQEPKKTEELPKTRRKPKLKVVQ